MTAATAQRIVDRSFATGETAERIAAAQFAGRLAAMDPMQFAEQVGEMLVAGLNGDTKLGQSGMLWVRIRREVR